jgi:hypothetical protein
MNENILDEPQFESSSLRRRDLLPGWIKVFTWIFLIFGAMMPIVLILGIVGMNFQISLYGLETNQPLSLIGIFLTAIFALKGVTAFGLWTEKEWAVQIAILDAVFGIILCIYLTILSSATDSFGNNIRLEILILIPYLIKMIKIKSDWKEGVPLKK